ncbi:unnamed protein product [Adineta steineri]|uniref:Uncharacterized protein n=1 Tax=Adineta steineri TaxID=433720 RepID=A0A813Y5E1_9BILA|nr:unnamed protein product [Adineta steineri]CAF0914660.1 unnamed protein product [Adineta steineri]
MSVDDYNNNNSNNEQIQSLTRDLELMRERYLKLVDVHGKLQQETSVLEERILSIVETYSNERNQLEQDLIDAKHKILHLQDTVDDLEIEKQRYKNDCNLAVRLLHRHPNEFMPPPPSTTTLEQIQEQSKTKNESVATNQSQHSLIIPTFPPMFVQSIPSFNTNTSSSSPAVSQPPASTTSDTLRFAESLFKTNNVHRYPSTHFICSNCHQTIKCHDVSVQTSLDDRSATTRTRLISLTASDDSLDTDLAWNSLEPHHAHMTVQEYQTGHARRSSQDAGLPSNSIPQMHHV